MTPSRYERAWSLAQEVEALLATAESPRGPDSHAARLARALALDLVDELAGLVVLERASADRGG